MYEPQNNWDSLRPDWLSGNVFDIFCHPTLYQSVCRVLAAPPIGGALYNHLGFRAPFIFGIIFVVIDFIGRLLVIERKDALKWGFDPTSPPPRVTDESETRTQDLHGNATFRWHLMAFTLLSRFSQNYKLSSDRKRYICGRDRRQTRGQRSYTHTSDRSATTYEASLRTRSTEIYDPFFSYRHGTV